MPVTQIKRFDSSRRAVLRWLSTLPVAMGAGGAVAATSPSLQDFGNQMNALPEITIYTAKRIITMAPETTTMDAVAVVGPRILAVGQLAELERLIGEQRYKIDRSFQGKVLIAGLIDQHLHPVLAALTLTLKIIAIEDWVLPTGTAKAAVDAASYMQRLKAAEAEITDPNEPLITWGYHHYFHGIVRRHELDAVSKTRPILIWHRSAHEFILNTAALNQFGITAEFVAAMPDSARAQSEFEKGHFFEQGGFAVMPKIASALATPERLAAGLNLTKDYLHKSGVTLTCEPGGIVAKPLQDAQNIVLGGPDVPFRTYYLPDGKTMAQLHIDGDIIGETEKLLSWGQGKTAFLPKQVKLFADGAIYSQLMQMKDGYTDGHSGEWIMDPDIFVKAFGAYWDAGYQIHIHQNGDAGLDLVLDTLERNIRRNPRFNHRTTIVHFGFSRTEQIPRVRALGAIVSANPYYVTALADRYGEVGVGAERADQMVRLGDADRENIPISFHSDMPMAPAQPLFLVWSAVNRTTVSGRVAGPNQRLTVEKALRAVTIDAAYSLGLEYDVGSIEPGKLANITVLESDPFEVEAAAIKDIAIWGTIHEGTVYPAPMAGGKKASNSLPFNFALASYAGDIGGHAAIASRGAHGGCGCCAPTTAVACSTSQTASNVTSTVGCCSTNAFGWLVAAHWAENLEHG